MTTPLPDLRPRVTARVATLLDEGRSCLIVGGPQCGKSRLLEELRAHQSDAADLVDDAALDQLPADPTKARAYTVGVEQLTEARILARKRAIAYVPLVNLPRAWLRAAAIDGDERWLASSGHPALAVAHGDAHATANLARELAATFDELLATRPTHKTIFEHLLAQAARSPTERYAQLYANHGGALKPLLDWLCTAGMVTRLIDGDAAGVTALDLRPHRS